MALFSLSALAVAAPARADLVRVPIEITVGSSQGEMEAIFGVAIHSGDVLHGSLSYDPSAPDASPDPGFGSFDPMGGALSIDLGSGVTLPLIDLVTYDTIPNQSPFDSDTFAGFAQTTSFPGFDEIGVDFDFQAPPPTRDTDALPRSAHEIATTFPRGSLRFIAFQTGKNPPFDDGTQSFQARLRAIDTATTPEPASLVLLGSGALMIVRRAATRGRRPLA